MKAFLAWLDRLATPRHVAFFFLLEAMLIGCENLLTFPLSVPYMRHATGHVYLDMCAFCSDSAIYDELSAFGEIGRRLQLWLLATIDMVIPAASALFGASTLALFTRALRARAPAYRLLPLVPVGAMLLDFTENLGIALLVSRYPERFHVLATLTGLVSGLKSVAYGLTLLGVVVLGLGVWLEPVRRKV